MSGTIVHLGLGAFHRAHQAAFIADAGGWRIAAVAMRTPDTARALAAQGGRYGLVIRLPGGPDVREIGVIAETFVAAEEPGAVADRIAAADVAIVTVTVTEKGYCAGPSGLDPRAPGVAGDLARQGPPRTMPGLLAEGLRRRRAAGRGGLTVISCDNLAENGSVLARVTLEMAGPDLAPWIDQTCRFPHTMVDRITPASTEETRAIASDALGWRDGAAVETEPFRQWVIEDAFAGPRPDWAAAGVQIVPDVAPYETMKLWMLNGAHSAMAYLGVLAGKPAVRDVMAEPVLAAAVARHMAAAGALVPGGLDVAAYAEALTERFRNVAIDHRCLQIATDGSQKIPPRIFGPVRAGPRDLGPFALAMAAWVRFLEGVSDGGATLPLNDPLAERLRHVSGETEGEARVAALCRLLDAEDLAEDGAWCGAVADWYARLRSDGVLGALRG